MTSFARIRPLLRAAAFVAALCALMAPATAGASVHAKASASKKKVKLPVVTRVSPMSVQIGQTLEIKGKYFIRGRYRNTVVFKRSGGRAVFVKANADLAVAQKDLAQTTAKLGNEEFLAKAPDAVVDKIRTRQQVAGEEVERITARLAGLS